MVTPVSTRLIWRSLEAASLLYKELKQLDRAADVILEASNLFIEHGTPDTAGITLDKAAK